MPVDIILRGGIGDCVMQRQFANLISIEIAQFSFLASAAAASTLNAVLP
jgi:hypothetical protein